MKKLIIIISLIYSISVNSEEINSCGYEDNPNEEDQDLTNCGSLAENGVFTVSKELMEKMYWSKYGMQCLYVYNTKSESDGWYYINQNGIGRHTPFVEGHDCGGFHEGLAVGVSYEKVVFFDQALSVVKATEYTWASDFEGGLSKVCTGDLTKKYTIPGEHFSLKGGQCGYINREFKIVVPIQYPHESTPPPPNT